MEEAKIQETATVKIRFDMFHRIKKVRPLPDLVLQVEFMNGNTKIYDVKPLMNKLEVFKDLTRNGLFDLVRVDTGGYGIVWNDYIDLFCNELWKNGKSVSQQRTLQRSKRSN